MTAAGDVTWDEFRESALLQGASCTRNISSRNPSSGLRPGWDDNAAVMPQCTVCMPPKHANRGDRVEKNNGLDEDPTPHVAATPLSHAPGQPAFPVPTIR